ncbi:MAG: arsenate reductase ArsC [Alphaproteobacteria bacterium]
MTANRIYNVLFLCTGNSARSILAEAILNRLGLGKFQAFSAGSQPKPAPNPHAIALLKQLNHPTDTLRSKSWDEFAADDAPALDFVFTLCDSAAGEACPAWPGQPMTAHWGFEDPAKVEAEGATEADIALAFADAYKQIHNMLDVFINLPLASLDRLSLQQRLDEMGRSRDSAA